MTVLDAINDTARALTNLSKVLVAVGEQTQGVPVAKAVTVEAIEPEEAAMKEEKKSANVTKKPEAEVTMEMIRGVLAEKSQAGLTSKVKALLEKFGANKLSTVKPEDYTNLMAAAKELK